MEQQKKISLKIRNIFATVHKFIDPSCMLKKLCNQISICNLYVLNA